jgi:hypothetical protein
MAGQLVYQLLTDIAAVLVVAFLLSLTVLVYWKRVLFVALFGPVGWFSISVPYMVWYQFPLSFTMGALLEAVLGWLVVGLVLGGIVKQARNAVAA